MYLKTKAMKMMYYLLGWDLSCWVPWALWSAEAARVHGAENWGLVEAGRQGFFLPAVRMVEEKAPGCVSASTSRGRAAAG